MNDLLNAFIFFLPAGVANLTPVLVSRIPMLESWTAPLDFGRSYKDKRLFGSNKTWRGLICGTVAAGLTGYLLHDLAPGFTTPSILQACAMGAGALLGDAVESFFKRQRGIGPGSSWFPFDQTDYIIGGLLLALPFGLPDSDYIPLIFGLYFGLHLLFSYIGFVLKLKDKPI